jgi:hypothetical protein
MGQDKPKPAPKSWQPELEQDLGVRRMGSLPPPNHKRPSLEDYDNRKPKREDWGWGER